MKKYISSILYFFVVTMGLGALTFLGQIPEASALNVQCFRPNIAPHDYLTLDATATVPENGWDLSLAVNYPRFPLKADTLGGNVVNYMITTELGIAYGLNDWFEIGAHIPVNVIDKLSGADSKASFGDLWFHLKMTLLGRRDQETPWGFALKGIGTAPNGKESRFFGDGNATGALMTVTDVEFGDHRLALNLGARFRERETVLTNLIVNHEFLYGLAYRVRLVESWNFHLLAELNGSSAFRKLFSEQLTSPTEFLVAFRKYFSETPGLWGTVGGGVGGFLTLDSYGAPDYRAFLQIGYEFEGEGHRSPEPLPPPPVIEEEPTPPPTVNIIGGINFASGSADILPESYATLNQIFEQLKNHPTLRISIEGHTDDRGGDAANQVLSEKRAAAVESYFIQYGIEASRLVSVGYGESQPRVSNTTAENRKINRRIEIHNAP